MRFGIFVASALATEFLQLDERGIEWRVMGEKLCSQSRCIPLVFEESDEFQVVLPGQMIRKGLHITMDLSTNLKMAKRLKEVSSFSPVPESESIPLVVSIPIKPFHESEDLDLSSS